MLLLDEPLARPRPATPGRAFATSCGVLLDELDLPTLLVTTTSTTPPRSRIGSSCSTGRVLQPTPRPLVAARRTRSWPSSPATVLPGPWRAAGDGLTGVTLDEGAVVVRSPDPGEGRVAVLVHPWDVAVSTSGNGAGANRVEGLVSALAGRGDRIRLRVGAVTAEVAVARADALGLAEGSTAVAEWPPERTRLLPA